MQFFLLIFFRSRIRYKSLNLCYSSAIIGNRSYESSLLNWFSTNIFWWFDLYVFLKKQMKNVVKQARLRSRSEDPPLLCLTRSYWTMEDEKWRWDDQMPIPINHTITIFDKNQNRYEFRYSKEIIMMRSCNE